MASVIWVLWSLLVAFLGRDRALGFWGFLLASMVFSPILLTLVLVFSRPHPVSGAGR